MYTTIVCVIISVGVIWMIKISQKAFGDYIKQKRCALKLSREQLAEKLGVSVDAIAKWEQGNRYPDFEMVAMLAEALETTVQDIYDNSKASGNDVKKVVITSIISIFIVVVGTIIGLRVWAKYNENPSDKEDTIVVEIISTEDTEVNTIDVNESVHSSEDIISTDNSMEETTITPTQAIKEVGNYSLFHDGILYYVEHSDYINKAPDKSKAKYVGEISMVDNTKWPTTELYATYFATGSAVYEIDGVLYVYEATHYYRLYAEKDALQKGS